MDIKVGDYAISGQPARGRRAFSMVQQAIRIAGPDLMTVLRRSMGAIGTAAATGEDIKPGEVVEHAEAAVKREEIIAAAVGLLAKPEAAAWVYDVLDGWEIDGKPAEDFLTPSEAIEAAVRIGMASGFFTLPPSFRVLKGGKA